MCGILGYYGKKDAFSAEIVINGLKKLEYRGYDSAGIAIPLQNEFLVHKKTGKIDEVFSNFNSSNIKSSSAIGHSRWATHGGVTCENAHPHISSNGKIAVVHNGIIENYQELRNSLIKKGFIFKSQTDTEVIPVLIEDKMKSGLNFKEAFKSAIRMLNGGWAILAYNLDENTMIGARHESPLVLGVGNEEYFISSDIVSFIDKTKKVMYLQDYDAVIITPLGIEIYNFKEDKNIERIIDSISWDAEQAKKGDFEHFMLKEISEQAEVIERAVLQDEKIIEELSKNIKNAKGIYFVGCGTAYHACLEGSYIFSKIAKIHVNVCLASEFPNYSDFLTPESLIIAISQSGETADTLNAIRAAKSKNSKVLSIVNVMGSSLVRESDHSLMQHAGPEISVLSTKSYTSQIAIITLLAYALAGKLNEGKAKIKELVRYIYYLTSKNTRDYLKKLAKILENKKDIYLIGRSLEYPTALEAALKIKEVSYIHAEGFAGGELKHGVIALIEKGTPCIVFTSEKTEKEIISNAMELKARGAYIIGVGPKNNEVFDFFIKIREAEEANSLVQIIPMQILAYQLAIIKNLDPDRPRNLAKSVTVK